MKVRNPRSNQWLVTATAGLIILAAVSGCANPTRGTAQPVSSSGVSTAPTKPSDASITVFGNLTACEVLDKALEGQGFPPGMADNKGGDNGCRTNKAQFGTASVDLQPDQGIDQLRGDPTQIRSILINDRRAAEDRGVIGVSGGCAIAIEVTKTSRALVVAVLSTGTKDESCAFVTDVAKKIEPQLPKGR